MILLLAGVSGSGKSAVGSVLASRLGWAFEDSDLLHSADQIAKMRSGVALTDTDRWPWLEAVAAWMDQRIAAGESGVMACSALKRSYRDFLCRDRPSVQVVLLEVDQATLRARLQTRQGHFFPAKLLQSQLADLEPPGPDERALVVTSLGTPAGTAAEIIDRLRLTPSPA